MRKQNSLKARLLYRNGQWVGPCRTSALKIGGWNLSGRLFGQQGLSICRFLGAKDRRGGWLVIRGHATKKMNRKGELQTSRISSNLRIWQSYSRVPQILKLLCVCYSWKYVARLGFEPLKFLYGEFLYNTQAVLCFYCDYPCWNPNVICSPTSLPSGTQTFCLMENQPCIKLHSDYVFQHQKNYFGLIYLLFIFPIVPCGSYGLSHVSMETPFFKAITKGLPVLPHKAVAEVSKIGNL